MTALQKKKRQHVSISFILIWLFCLTLFIIFSNLQKIPLFAAIIVVISETILCLSIWLFFMIKIDWLKDINTGKEITHLNISNVLSSVRFTLVPLLITMLGLVSDNKSSSQFFKFFIIFLGAATALTDLFDGMLARKRNECTILGKIIDPVGDFLMILSFSILIYAKGIITWWFFILILIRIPFFSLIMVYMLVKKIDFHVKTTPLGKTTIFYTLCLLCIACLPLIFNFESKPFSIFLYITQSIGAVIIVLSSLEKLNQFSGILEEHESHS